MVAQHHTVETDVFCMPDNVEQLIGFCPCERLPEFHPHRLIVGLGRAC